MGRWETEFLPSSLALPRMGNVFWKGKEITEWLELGHVRVKVSVEKAILVVLPDGDEVWIPRSQIVDEVSAIKRNAWRGQSGLLCISEWFGAKQGW